MIPGKLNFSIIRGGTCEISFTATDNDGDITFSDTYTSAALTIYKAWLSPIDYTPDTKLFEANTDNGYLTIDGKTILLYIPAAITNSLSFKEGVYRLGLIHSSAVDIVDFMLVGSVLITNGDN